MITRTIPIDQITPYENNPRDNTQSISKVAESIRSFGFLQPIVCDANGVILAGHTRFQAALQLGLKEVPVRYANDLTPAQARAYRLADNKVGEGSLWLEDLLSAEWDAVMAESPELLPAVFGFDLSTEARQWKSWENAGKRCDLTKKITLRTKGGF